MQGFSLPSSNKQFLLVDLRIRLHLSVYVSFVIKRRRHWVGILKSLQKWTVPMEKLSYFALLTAKATHHKLFPCRSHAHWPARQTPLKFAFTDSFMFIPLSLPHLCCNLCSFSDPIFIYRIYITAIDLKMENSNYVALISLLLQSYNNCFSTILITYFFVFVVHLREQCRFQLEFRSISCRFQLKQDGFPSQISRHVCWYWEFINWTIKNEFSFG